MERLLQLAIDLTAGLGSDVRLIGGLAVRILAGSGARLTRDLDLVPMTPVAEQVLVERLAARGFIVGDSRHWRRAVLPGSREIVDVLRHPIVNPRTFEAATLRDSPIDGGPLARGVPVAGISDMARLKLIAARDQDLVDLLLLAAQRPSARRIAEGAELDELERAVSAGAQAARRALESGELDRCAEELLGRTAEPEELAALRGFLAALHSEGL